MMDLYEFYNKPELLNNYEEAYNNIPELFWNKFLGNHSELKKRENAIAKDGWYSYFYAQKVLKGPFPKGEEAIATNAQWSYDYALDVLNGRFPKGEKALTTNGEWAYFYAKNVLKGPFDKAEDAILKSPYAGKYLDLIGK